MSILEQYLDKLYPNPKCELEYKTTFELLISVMLSSQTLDKRVNEVTKILFLEFDTIEKLKDADVYYLEKILRPLGLSKIKATNIKNISKDILEKYNAVVPNNFIELTSLRGIGEKTAGVVLIEGFDIPDFPVDTHVLRVSKRLNLISNDFNATKTTKKLKEIFEQNKWKKLHKQMVLFGRYHCLAKKPKCDVCEIKSICIYK